MQVRPCRPRAKRPKDSWDIRAEQGLSLGSGNLLEVLQPQLDSAVLGLQAGRLVLSGFLLLMIIYSSLIFLTSSTNVGRSLPCASLAGCLHAKHFSHHLCTRFATV